MKSCKVTLTNEQWDSAKKDFVTMTETREIKVGDYVEFKCDVEQSAKVIEIRRINPRSYDVGFELLVNVTEGGYGHGEQWIPANEIF